MPKRIQAINKGFIVVDFSVFENSEDTHTDLVLLGSLGLMYCIHFRFV